MNNPSSPPRRGFCSRFFVPALLALCTSAFGQVKWNPGHYARITGDTPSIQNIESFGIDHPGITGVVIRIPWKTMEPEKDQYDLSRIQYYLDYLAPLGKHLIIELRERNYATSATNNDDALPAYLAGYVVKGSSQNLWLPNYGEQEVIDRYVALLAAIGRAYDLNPNFEGLQSGEQAIFSAGGTSWLQNFVQLGVRGRAAMPHTLFWAPMVGQMLQDPAYYEPMIAAGCGEYIIDSPVREVPNSPDGWNRFALNHPNELPIKANGEVASWHDEDSDPANGGPAIYYNTAVNVLHANHVAWTAVISSNSSHPTARPNWWHDVVTFLDHGGNPLPTNSTVPANITVAVRAPSRLTVTPVWARRVDLTWTDNAADETQFLLERRTGDNGYVQIAALGAIAGTGATGNYSDTTVVANTTYRYRIRAVSSSGSSSYSNEVLVTTPPPDTVPPVITSLTASPNVLRPPNHKMVSVTVAATLTDNIDPAPTARIVGVDCNEASDDSCFEITGDLTVNLRAERAGSGPGRIYTLHVEGRDLSGNVTSGVIRVTVPHDDGRDRTSPTVSITAPAPDSGVTGSAVTVAADAVDDVAVAGVQFKLDGANLGAERTVVPYALSWDTTTAADGPHTLTAIARDEAGNATVSAPVNVEVVNPPAAPSGLVAVAPEPGQVDLTWDDNSDYESAFRIERRSASADYAPLAATAADVVAFSDTAVLPGSSYTYRVRAENAIGVSDWSNEASVITPGPRTIEFESADVAAHTDPFDIRSSSGDLLFKATGTGDAITFAVGGLPAGDYSISVRSQFGQNRAIYQLETCTALDGSYELLGAPVDTYVAGFVSETVNVATGVHLDAAETRYFRFRIVGRNASSKARYLSLDRMVLTPE